MMRTLVKLYVLLIVFLNAPALWAQNFEQRWKIVEEMEQKDLPKSAILEAQKIYDLAKKEGNVPQMMKAYLSMMYHRGEISPDSIPVDIEGLEDWAGASTTSVPDKAVLYSILGGIILSDDFEKGNRFLKLSLKDSTTLATYPADRLTPIVRTEEASRLYTDNNLYDLLARRAIECWEQNRWRSEMEEIDRQVRDTYQSLLNLYHRTGNRPAWLLTALDAYPSASETQLREWLTEYQGLDVCAEVYLRLAEKGKQADRLALLQEAIGRYPRYYRINALKNKAKEILAPRLNISAYYAYPDQPMELTVDYVNMKGFSLYIYQLDLAADSPLLSGVTPKNVKKYGTLWRSQHISLPEISDYEMRREVVNLDAPKAGIYYLVAAPEGFGSNQRGVLVSLTNLHLLYRSLSANRQELVVVDKQSGHPVPGAKIDAYDRISEGYQRTETYQADAQGVVTLSGKSKTQGYFQAYTPEDKAMPIQSVYFSSNSYTEKENEEQHIQLFTDRGLYRPGQQLHFSGVVYKQWGDSVRVKEAVRCEVRLLDADGQEVAKKVLTTDAFGSFAGNFQLPTGGKNGTYRLLANRTSTAIRVEAYKRPTFEVTFEPVADAYQAGDSIWVKGSARSFTGVPLPQAAVKYTIVRRNGFWRRGGVETHRVEGETVTDSDGCFEVPVHFLPVDQEDRFWHCTYEVSADVTSISGETQTGVVSLPLGSSSVMVSVAGWNENNVVKENRCPLTLEVRNRVNQPVATTVDWQVYPMDAKTADSPLCKGQAMSNQAFVPEAIYALPSGQYRLRVTAKDEAGRESVDEVTFVLFSLADRSLPFETKEWVYQTSEEFDGDQPVTVLFGSSEKEVYLFYDVFAENRRVESRRISFSDSLLSFRFTYQEAYGKGLKVCFAYVKNGSLYQKQLEIRKPQPDKELKLTWKTFRDKLQPGTQETWTLNILGPDGKPADAQLLATLYDASLDRLSPYQWNFNLNFNRYFPGVYWRAVSQPGMYWGFSFPQKYLNCPALEYSQLEVPFRARMFGMEEVLLFKSNAAVADRMVETRAESAEAETEETVNQPLRTNFAETAFFYPHLRTNAEGEVDIEFTLPESLTEWKFMGWAHTKEMDHGMITAKAVAAKEFMLQPNLPRFVRVGDQVKVAASLVNLSDRNVSGVVRMELLDPATEKVVFSKSQKFSVGEGATKAVSFAFEADNRFELLVCRMVAEGKNFSDGEQRYLPVLSNQQRVTESVLLDVNGAGTSVFSLEELFNHHSPTVMHPKMTVEFTGNPIWYAVQALPVMAEPESDNALSWATAYYALSLTDYLVGTVPQIADSLNVEGLDGRISAAMEHLQGLQQANGAWSWFKGMSGSRSMTTQITEMLARLQRMSGVVSGHKKAAAMYRKAFDYLTKEVGEEVARMKASEEQGVKKQLLSEQALKYLYICALDEALQPRKDDFNFLVNRLAEHPGTQTIYGKALEAVVLHAAGKESQAKERLQSLMEYSVVTPEMGRYFDTPKAVYSWFSYRIPTQVAAIEAVNRLTKDKQTVEEMKRWLLKQKQAQDWKTPVATADAVYALLTTGEDWLAHSGAVKITLGKQVIETAATSALGYVKQEVSGDVWKIKEATVEKQSEGMGWGAVYAEFLEDMDRVAVQGNALKVERTLFKDGRPLPSDASLEVGDRLTVRLTVTADRDMDFVQVKDERAACMEPVDALSGYRWTNRIGYYQETKDASTAFYLDRMRKGTYELEYQVFITSEGRYLQGIATVQSVYAPEFGGHSGAGSIEVK